MVLAGRYGTALYSPPSALTNPRKQSRLVWNCRNTIAAGWRSGPKTKKIPRGYANALGVLAVAYQATGEQDKAVQVSEEAEAFYDEALKKDPGNLSLLADAGEAAMNLSYRVSPISQWRSRDAELIARERYRTLTTLDPANADWRYHFAKAHMMECYYLEGDGQIEAARQAFKKFDSLLQTVTIQPWDEQKPLQNSVDLARLAAMAGDNADARAQLAVAESRFQAHYDQLPDAPFDRLQARIRWLNLEALVYYEMHDWTELERIARTTLAAIDEGLSQRPGDSELLLRRAVSQMFQGIAWLRQDHAPEAVSALDLAVTGYRDTPPAIAFTDNRAVYSTMAYMNLAEALAKSGNRERARSLAETGLAKWEAAVASDPSNWEGKETGAKLCVNVASLLDPAKPDEAARHQSLLDRAATILTSPESVGRLKVDDKELLAKIASMRAASGTPEQAPTKQP
jgi:tetratricopeptide (TPR) repeat protein